jgi:hypothetical protein
MLKKAYREMNDGLGTVMIGLELPKNRLTALHACPRVAGQRQTPAIRLWIPSSTMRLTCA